MLSDSTDDDLFRPPLVEMYPRNVSLGRVRSLSPQSQTWPAAPGTDCGGSSSSSGNGRPETPGDVADTNFYRGFEWVTSDAPKGFGAERK